MNRFAIYVQYTDDFRRETVEVVALTPDIARGLLIVAAREKGLALHILKTKLLGPVATA